MLICENREEQKYTFETVLNEMGDSKECYFVSSIEAVFFL